MSKLFKELKKGFHEMISHKKGKITLLSEKIEIPEPPLPYSAEEIKVIRQRGPYSQGVFARILNVSTKTVQSWETGERVPSHSALRLLEIIDKGIYRPSLFRKTT